MCVPRAHGHDGERHSAESSKRGEDPGQRRGEWVSSLIEQQIAKDSGHGGPVMNSKTSRLRARNALHFAALLGTASFAAMAASGAAQAQGQAQAQASEMVPEQVLITGSLISGAVAVGVPVSDL